MIKTQAFKMFSQLENQHSLIHFEKIAYEINPRDNSKEYAVSFIHEKSMGKEFHYSKTYQQSHYRIQISVDKNKEVFISSNSNNMSDIENNVQVEQVRYAPTVAKISIIKQDAYPTYFSIDFFNMKVEGKSLAYIQNTLSNALTQLQEVMNYAQMHALSVPKFVRNVSILLNKDHSLQNAIEKAHDTYVEKRYYWHSDRPLYPVYLIGERTLNEKKHQAWKGKTIRTRSLYPNEVSYDFELCHEKRGNPWAKYAKKLNNRVLRQKGNQAIKNYMHGKGEDVDLSEYGVDFWMYD